MVVVATSCMHDHEVEKPEVSTVSMQDNVVLKLVEKVEYIVS